MRLLALSTWWPEPADNGARLRINALVRSLAAYHEIHLLALSQEPVQEEARRRLEEICASVHSVPQRVWKPQRGEQIVSLWHPTPTSFRATWNPEFAQLVHDQVRHVQPDLVIVFQSAVAPYVEGIPESIPCLLEELEISRFINEYQQQQQPIPRLRAWVTWTKHRSYIQRLLRRFSACTVVSEAELALARSIIPASMRTAVIPNGADLAGVGAAAMNPSPGTLIYPGALSYDANLDAMRYFLDDIFPQVQAAYPRATLRITGKSTPEQRAALPARDGVEHTGYVTDVRALIAQSWCEVVPLRTGGGTRLKILEALAIRTPVVTTSKGAEGLALQHEKHVLIADTPEGFAEQTIRLLNSPALRSQLIDAGYQFVHDHYDWRVIGSRLNALLTEIASVQPHTRHREYSL